MFDDVQIHDTLKVYTTGGDFTGVLCHSTDIQRVVRLRASNGKIIRIRESAVTAVVAL